MAVNEVWTAEDCTACGICEGVNYRDYDEKIK
jgi:hypothetical protein